MNNPFLYVGTIHNQGLDYVIDNLPSGVVLDEVLSQKLTIEFILSLRPVVCSNYSDFISLHVQYNYGANSSVQSYDSGCRFSSRCRWNFTASIF